MLYVACDSVFSYVGLDSISSAILQPLIAVSNPQDPSIPPLHNWYWRRRWLLWL